MMHSRITKERSRPSRRPSSAQGFERWGSTDAVRSRSELERAIWDLELGSAHVSAEVAEMRECNPAQWPGHRASGPANIEVKAATKVDEKANVFLQHIDVGSHRLELLMSPLKAELS
jgi:hypothetical protein